MKKCKRVHFAELTPPTGSKTEEFFPSLEFFFHKLEGKNASPMSRAHTHTSDRSARLVNCTFENFK